jgi:hypothetical protein
MRIRLSKDDWFEAVGRAYQRSTEAHEIGRARAKKFVPLLTEMCAECGPSAMLAALGAAIRRASRSESPLAAESHPKNTVKDGDRVTRFSDTLRFRQAADVVRDSLEVDVDDDAHLHLADDVWQEIGRQLAAEAA